MKILVLGADGQVGQCLANRLASTTYEIIFTNRSDIDITDVKGTRIKICSENPDVLINASAYTAVDKAESASVTADQVNHLAVDNLAKICVDIESVLIHISTDYVFDGSANSPYKEDAEANPSGVYGKTKLLGELAIQQSGCRYLIFRTAWLFSEYGNNFLKTMLHLGSQRDELNVVSDQIGCPTYAGDLTKIIAAALLRIEEDKCEYGIYHYCGDTSCSRYDFAVQIFQEARKYGVRTPIVNPVVTSDYPTPAQRPSYSVLDNNKAFQAFGVSPSDWVVGIEHALHLMQER